jgi:hypothetical protein
VTRGTFIDESKIKCVSPPADNPGYVNLIISYEGDKYDSESVEYLYYETPVVADVLPTCGPVTGYTQLTIVGKNFIDMGFGKVKCIFNNTIQMNATIMDETLIKCDSPPLEQGHQTEGNTAPFYFVSLTLNGREFTENKYKFQYYIDPKMKIIWPNTGPMSGNTSSNITGKGFKQPGVCNITVRYGSIT